MTTYSKEERDEQIKKMRTVAQTFYGLATRTGTHAFIEFCGFMMKFIDICQNTSASDIDFNESNTHTGGELVVHDHDLVYLAEKFDCIFGPTLANEENRKVFFEAMGWAPVPTGIVEMFRTKSKECTARAGECRSESYERYEELEAAKVWEEAAKLIEGGAPERRQPPTKQQWVIEQLCKMMGRVYSALDPHAHQACDCICKPRSDYRNHGHVLEVMEEAISALVAAMENPKNTEEHRGARVASAFREEHLQRLIDDEKVSKELQTELAKWFQKHAEATRVRVSHLERAPLTHVACKDTEGRVWSLPKPFRHHDVLRLMHEHGAKNDEDRAYSQGFLDADGRYLHRKAAMVSAEVNNQILRGGKMISPGTFTSEDVW